jgi:hypothetical protein
MNKPTKLDISGTEIILPNPILKKCLIGEDWLIIFDWRDLPDAEKRRNVRLYDSRGNLKWTIASSPTQDVAGYPHPWMNFRFDDNDGRWIVDNLGGNFYFLDLTNGSVEFKFWTR